MVAKKFSPKRTIQLLSLNIYVTTIFSAALLHMKVMFINYE